MLGEELNSSYVTERGLVGNCTYALIDQKTGKVASAKNPRKWGKLFDFRAAIYRHTISSREHSTRPYYLSGWHPDFLL